MTEQQKENLSKGHKFSTENQPEKNGRKRSKIKDLIEVNDLTAEDISDLIKSMMDKTQDELNVIKDDHEQPFLIRSFVKAMLKDIESESLYNINSLLDRAVGKSVEKKEVEFSGSMPIINIVSKID